MPTLCRRVRIDLISREFQEIRDALEAFKAALQAGEMTGPAPIWSFDRNALLMNLGKNALCERITDPVLPL
jgi:hypothetical protein